MDPAFFNLKTHPFQSRIDPSRIWRRGYTAKIYAGLEKLLRKRVGIYVITGPQGAGKTTFLNYLAAVLGDTCIVVNTGSPPSDELKFYLRIARELGLRKNADNKTAFLVSFRHALAAVYERRQKLIFLIDDADRLPLHLLKDLHMMSRIKMGQTPITSLVFAGAPRLAESIPSLDRDFQQDIVKQYALKKLSKSETAQYIRHRLAAAGGRRKVFTGGAVGKIHQYSDGLPGRIHSLCRDAFEQAYELNKKKIDARMVAECIRERRRRRPIQLAGDASASRLPAAPTGGRYSAFFRILVAVSAGAFLMSGIYLFMETRSDQGSQWSIDEIAPKENERLNDQLQEKNEQLSSTQPEASSNPEAGQADHRSDHARRSSGTAPANARPETSGVQWEDDFVEKTIRIYFKIDSNELQEEALTFLDRVADFLKARPDVAAVITGYTDSSGPRDYNMAISRIRAESIASYLMAKGVDRRQLQTFGRGPRNPIESNRTAKGRRLNRRVEIEFRPNNG